MKAKLLNEVDKLIAEAKSGKEIPSDVINKLDDIAVDLKKHKEDKLSKEQDKRQKELLKAIKEIKIEVPDIVVPKIEVPETKIPEIKVEVPEVKIPEIKPPELPEINIPEVKLPTIVVPEIQVPEIKVPKVVVPPIKFPKFPAFPKFPKFPEFPTKATKPMSVRLSDGNRFYKAIGNAMSTLGNLQTFATSDNSKKPALVDDDGHVQVDVQSTAVVSEDNSKSTPMGANEVFTGQPIDILDCGIIFVNVSTDVASATDGLAIEQSSDGDNWDHDDVYTVPAGGNKNYSINPYAKYLRVIYTNGSSVQGYFRLQTICKANSKPSSHRIKDSIVDDDDAELVKSVVAVQTNDENTYKNVDVQNPMPVDGDTAYGKDLDLDRIDTSGWTGDVSDLFGSLTDGLTQTGSTNPKNIIIYFRRTLLTHAVAFTSATGNFSNIKLVALLGGGAELPLYDGSADGTNRTSQSLQFSPIGVEGFRVECHTADDVTLSNMIIFKTGAVVARLQAISQLTDLVENIASFRGALKVDQALVHKVGISEHAKRDLGATTTLDVLASSGDTLINVADTTGFLVGDTIRISDTTVNERSHFHITAVDAGVSLTLNRPLDNDFEVGDDVTEIQITMNQVGSLASPVSFKVAPPSSERWQITRIMTTMLDATAMDDGKFGGLTALTNGVAIRVVNNGTVRTLTHWKSNADLKDDMYDVTYSTKPPAGTFHGLSSRWTFTKGEFVVDLDGSTSDYLEILLQDDLSGLVDFEVKAQGRLFGG